MVGAVRGDLDDLTAQPLYQRSVFAHRVYGRRRGIIRQSHERGDDKNLGTSCPKVDYFSISFFLSGLPSSGGCLAFQSSSRDMI